ncbi:hypothetical protein PGT21_023487 [Puccinia graminis f. sp. tritici]|uniref:Uncharacterized protein n=1 Tax=Puccinia graminis f. sp. tritici TaxID=56615 RepID=A0A5B0MT47_PUCGR|nr:hypothetical protein PGT21_023487 [Puccinia graminis f. sp. tritici]
MNKARPPKPDQMSQELAIYRLQYVNISLAPTEPKQNGRDDDDDDELDSSPKEISTSAINLRL